MKQQNLINQIFNRIMVNGKKRTAEKILIKASKKIQKQSLKKNFSSLLRLSVINTSPLFFLKQIKRKRKRMIEFPFLLTSKLKLSYAIKFLVLSSKKKKMEPFFKNFCSELVNSSKKTSVAYKQKLEMHKESFAKRKFANYRWF